MKRMTYIVLALLLLLCSCGQPSVTGEEENVAPTWQEQYDLGVRYLSEGNYEEAIIAFTAAIEIDPKRAEAYVGRGDAYIGLGETEENLTAARADYEKAIELDETNADAYLGLADVYIRQGDEDKALEILREGEEKAERTETIEREMEWFENYKTEMENPPQVDITKGYWETNGYRLSDTCVYCFQPNGTFMMQMGMSSIPAQGRYEYTGQTLTLFYRDEIDDILNYDAEKQIFISSQRMVLVEQAFEHLNPEGTDKFAAETLSFLVKAPEGFFKDETVQQEQNTEPEKSPSIGYANFYPIDYIGMSINSFAKLWGEDFNYLEYWLSGGLKAIYYEDLRIPMMFYYLDPDLAGKAKGNEEIAVVECYPQEPGSIKEIAPGISLQSNYAQLMELGYELIDYSEFGEYEFGATFATDLEYNPVTSIMFFWFDYDDPSSTPAQLVLVWDKKYL